MRILSTLALGLACFVTAYAVVDYWQKSERQFANADRIAVISTAFTAVDDTFSTGAIPWTALHLAEYLKADFPQIESTARAIPGDDTGVSNGDRSLRVFRVIADAEFLEIFDLPFIAGNARDALRQPNSVVLSEETAIQLFGDEDPMGQNVIIASLVDATVTGVVGTIPDPSHMGAADSSPMGFDLLASWNVYGEIMTTRWPERPYPPPEEWGSLGCITYVLLPEDGSLTMASMGAQLLDFVDRHVPPEQMEFATLDISALPVSGLKSPARRNSASSALPGGPPRSKSRRKLRSRSGLSPRRQKE